MKNNNMIRGSVKQFGIAILMAWIVSLSAEAATKKYQVTGSVLEADQSKIVVQKGKEKWVLQRNPSTHVSGDLKPGSKATIEYQMVATNAETKPNQKK